MTDNKKTEEEEIKNPVYIVNKPYGKHKRGVVLPMSREVRRKLGEGDTIKVVDKSKLQDELKKIAPKVKNKMQDEPVKNKGAK